MSYKTDLQSNNTRLNALKTEINNLPDYVDTTDANATESDILSGKSGYVNGVKVNGSLGTETKTVKSTTTSQTVTPTAGKFINEITVEPIELEQITVTPSTTQQIITPSLNKDGISQVTASPVTSAIDENIISGNIKANSTILGVQGKSSVVDTETATAQAKDIVQGKTAFVNGNQVTGTCDWQNIEWQPQPDWWDIKTIVENDTENYPYKIIALHDEGAKKFYYQVINNVSYLSKIKLSDGQEITNVATAGVYTIDESGFKTCSKGYKTCYSIWYFNTNPDFAYKSFGAIFPCSRYIYFYNVTNMLGRSTTNWLDGYNKQLEAVESNIQFSTTAINMQLYLVEGPALQKLPNYIWRRNDTPSPAMVSISVMPRLNYRNISNIIKNRTFNFSSGQMPRINSSFIGEVIDFENDWGIDTTLFTSTNICIGPNAIRKLDCRNITSFAGTTNVTEIYEISNIKVSNSYFNNAMLSYDTLIRVLNALWDYSESNDIYTLTLGTINLAKLTADDKAIATNKGWTLA